MATFNPISAPKLIITATDYAGSPLAGAAVSFVPVVAGSRILPGGITAANGRYLVLTNGWPPDVSYTVTVIAKGYAVATAVVTAPQFSTVEKVITCFPEPLVGYSVDALPAYVSVASPGALVVHAPTSAAFGYAVVKVSDEVSSRPAEYDTPISVNGVATLGLQDIVAWPARQFLTTDDVDVDTTMSRRYTLAASVESGSVSRVIDRRLTTAIMVGVDPNEYIDTNSRLARWLTPWPNQSFVHISGIYADVLILLTAGSYKLRQTQTGSPTVAQRPDWPFVSDGIHLMRVRIPQPRPGDTYAELQVLTSANLAVSQTLKVTYRAI